MKPKADRCVIPSKSSARRAIYKPDPWRTRPAHSKPPQAYPAEKARQGKIVLKTKWSRVVFLTGLFGSFLLLAVLAIVLGIVG